MHSTEQQIPKPWAAGSNPAVSTSRRKLAETLARCQDHDFAIAVLELTRHGVTSEVDDVPAWDDDLTVHTGVMFSKRFGRKFRERGVVKLTFSFDERESLHDLDAEFVQVSWSGGVNVVSVDTHVEPTEVERHAVDEAVGALRRQLEAAADDASARRCL